MVTLVAVALGVLLGIRGPVAHAEGASCIDHQFLPGKSVSLPYLQGTLTATVWARYNSYNGSYCEQAWAHSKVVEPLGAPKGILYAELQDCAGNIIDWQTVHTNGGGATPQTYTVDSGKYDLGCARAYASFVPDNWWTSRSVITDPVGVQ
jgi:hypothetical protein